MIATALPNNWDILALQEPWIDHFGNTRASPKWSVIYPSTKRLDGTHPTRSVILINTKFPTESITQIPVASNDITAVKIKTIHHTLVIINIYNANDNNDSLDILSDTWEANEASFLPTPNTELLLLGDFNRHHSLWEEPANAHLTSPDRLLNPLLDSIINMRLEMVLPRGVPTLEARHGGRWTRPDNIWRNADSASTILSCEVRDKLRPSNTDHLPIITTLDLSYYQPTTTSRFNFRTINWTEFEAALDDRIKGSPILGNLAIQSTDELETAVDELFQTIQDITCERVPVIKPSPHLKRWWTKELTTKRKEKNRAHSEHFKWRGIPSHPAHKEFRQINNSFAKAIEDAKATHWQEWIENISGNDVWKVNKYMNASPTDFGCQRIPHLNRPGGTKTSTGAEKAERLADVFFPSPGEHPDDTPDFTERPHPTAPSLPSTTFSIFTADRVAQTLRGLSPFKAPGQSGIPNSVLKYCAATLAPTLATIYTSICLLDYYPTKFRNINQVVIRKPGRPSYEEANAYRPIALIETLAKVQSTIVTEDLTFICEKYDLLPAGQFGGRPGRTTNEALHLVEQFIRNAWRKGDVVSALFLDIQAAFPNMQQGRLLKNMRARNINEGFCRYVEMILTHRQIRLVFDDVTSQPCNPPGGCNQGCPLSMLLYVIYNAPLINIANPENRNERIIGFVDDTTLLAQGTTFNEAHQTLRDMMERKNGVFNWSRTYSSPLEMNKLALVNFSLSQAKVSDLRDLPLTQPGPSGITGHDIEAKPHAKLLGVTFDSRLSWTIQHVRVREKATKFTAAFRRFTRATSGIRPAEALKLYNAVAVTRICYAADLWYTPPLRKSEDSKRQGSVRLTKQLESIQRQAAIAITGAMRTTAGDAAIVHAGITPIALQLEQSGLITYARLATRPDNHPIRPAIRRTHRTPVLHHRTALHRLAAASSFNPNNMERITPTRAHPSFNYPHELRIASTKKESIKWDCENFARGIMIYTDGSCYKKGIGASAILYIDGIETDHLRLHLGADNEHTVFDAELTGIILGSHLATKHLEPHDNINFSIDNQAAIKSLKNNSKQSSQYLIDEIHRCAANIKRGLTGNHPLQPPPARRRGAPLRTSTISYTWVAGHMDSTGNERADEEAKKAAVDGSSPNEDLPPFLHHHLPTGFSAAKQAIKALIKGKTKKWWTNSPRFTKLNAIDPSLPSNKFLELASSLSRRQTSLLTQLRTGHIALNRHLHTIQRAPSPVCPQPTCRNSIEDIHHLLYICPQYIHARYHLTGQVAKRNISLASLLASSDNLPHTLTFLNSTGRLRHIFGDIAPVKES